MTGSTADQALAGLRRLLRPASVATVGGFRPPEDPLTSWFLHGTGRPGEALPEWRGGAMFPLLQIRVDELPFVPPQLEATAMLVLFVTLDLSLDAPHGEGWLIREYPALDGLVPLPGPETPYRPFPVRWDAVEDDAPGWEDAWSLMDLTPINRDEAASERFFSEFRRYDGTKVGGYPREVQHGAGVEDFVFQVGSEPKVGFMWGDRGIAYFHRPADGGWRFSCQFL
ncbi:DUF1963 domain-containing protein [Pararoseomonas sp. SCSIO 73927]|uniref:DUF1963 domain-containing protein n=1 Tax=Pararoseomonas sp. SCSIO 73927 TaxID=3114537 RepID=UPI0030CBD8C0